MSAFGFHNVAPMSREARRIAADRDLKEKDRLADRRSGYDLKPTEVCAMNTIKQQQQLTTTTGDKRVASVSSTANPNPRSAVFVDHHPMSPNEGSAGWLPDEERLHGDVAGDLKQVHDSRVQAQQAKFGDRRRQRVEAEAARWEALYASEREMEDRTKQLAGTSKRSSSSVGYNIVDGRWKSGPDAEAYQYHDSVEEWRAVNRSKALFDRFNNKDKINVLTGQPLPNYVVVPPKPTPPV